MHSEHLGQGRLMMLSETRNNCIEWPGNTFNKNEVLALQQYAMLVLLLLFPQNKKYIS